MQIFFYCLEHVRLEMRLDVEPFGPQEPTFHAIVGEALAELVDHDEADAGRVVGPTQFLEELRSLFTRSPESLIRAPRG